MNHNMCARFEKVSYEQFKKSILDIVNMFDALDEEFVDAKIRAMYDNIKLPKRATKGSMGYDFFSPINCIIRPNGNYKIPTGVRCMIDEGWGLQVYPRSGMGFKYGVKLANTVGIIDADYAGSDNEGHIFIKLVNDSSMAKPIIIESGDAFCQGILMPYGITYDDEATEIRNGGFGSTGR